MSAFAGGDVKVHFDNGISTVMKDRYDIFLEHTHTVKAESNKRKQNFIKQQFGPCVLLSDVKDVLEKHCDVLDCDGAAVVLPHFAGLSAGIPCVNRTPLSSSAHEHVDCCQTGKGATGEGSVCVLRICRTHDIKEVMVECVKGLQQKKDAASLSDAEFQQEQLEEIVGWAIHYEHDSLDFAGAWQRIRSWWIAIHGLVGTKEEIDHYFLSTLRKFQRRVDVESLIDNVITRDMKQLQHEADKVGVPTWMWALLKILHSGN